MHWLQFAAYFVCMLLFFAGVWFGCQKVYDHIDEKHARRFEEKVDRYRRGHR